MNLQAARTLGAAAAELHGPIIRTSTSVIGTMLGESVIVATAGWGYSVTVMMNVGGIAFAVRPRGWLRRRLQVDGAPGDRVAEILDPEHHGRMLELQPLLIELTPNALRLEHRYGTDVSVAIRLCTSLARRARDVQASAADDRLAVPA